MNVDGSRNAWLAQHPVLKRVIRTLHLASRKQLDIPWPRNICVANLTRPLPFPDARFDAVYSSHTIEHLYRNEALAMLKEAFRVVKPGGRCRTLVPDLESLIKEYRGEGPAEGYGSEFSDDPAHRLMSKLLMQNETRRGGRLRRVFDSLNDLHSHKWLYDGASLARLMAEAGFVDCRRREFLDTEIPHLDKVEQAGRVLNGAGVAVEGVKPG